MTDEVIAQTAKALLGYNDESKVVSEGIVTDLHYDAQTYDVTYKNTTLQRQGRQTITLTIQLDMLDPKDGDIVGNKILVVRK